jgi:PRTRC genetic system ThiF family protein
MKITRIHSFHPELICSNFHFIVIGAGGTGGYLIPNLARQVSMINQREKRFNFITIADADVTEEKNLIRQNFISSDIGMNKAEVMASRYSGAFGIPIASVNRYIEDEETLLKIMTQTPHTLPVVIGCVDNNKTRQMIAKLFYSRKKTFIFLDSGNEQYTGQVVFGFNGSGNGNPNLFYMPCITDVFPDVMEDSSTKFVTEMSCAEQAISHPQSIATNITAANILFEFCNMVLNSREIDGIKTNTVLFNTITATTTQFMNTDEQLAKRYIPKASAG